MAFKICIGDPKTKRSYQIEKDVPSLVGLKVRDKFDGSMVGLNGFTLQVTGGSDKEGFPMRAEIPGDARKKLLLDTGVGFTGWKKEKKKYFKHKGMRKRKLVRGNQISEQTMQINCKIIEGEGDAMLMLGIKPKEKKEEEKKE